MNTPEQSDEEYTKAIEAHIGDQSSSHVAAETGTPRTDAHVVAMARGGHGAVAAPSFARTLERELAQAQAEKERLAARLVAQVRTTESVAKDRASIQSALTEARARVVEGSGHLRKAYELIEAREAERDALQSRLSEVERERDSARSLAEDFRGESEANMQIISEFRADRDSLRAELEAVRNELASLTRWKSEASKIFNDLNLQEIGTLLDLPLGSDIAPHVLPKLMELLDENDSMKRALNSARKSW